jgi:hypothetical protein
MQLGHGGGFHGLGDPWEGLISASARPERAYISAILRVGRRSDQLPQEIVRRRASTRTHRISARKRCILPSDTESTQERAYQSPAPGDLCAHGLQHCRQALHQTTNEYS